MVAAVLIWVAKKYLFLSMLVLWLLFLSVRAQRDPSLCYVVLLCDLFGGLRDPFAEYESDEP